MTVPYESAAQVAELVKNKDEAKLAELSQSYVDYAMRNQCELLDERAWSELGKYFLTLARRGSHGLRQTRQEFEKATAGMLRHPIPDWIQTVEYVQTELNGVYYLALPPKELAEQAYIHAQNPKAEDAHYTVPPIYSGIASQIEEIKEIIDGKEVVQPRAETILNTRICDYVISHCQ